MTTANKPFVNHYEVLGVPNDATERDIKKAYRARALELHPDRNHGKEEQAGKLFNSMKQSYEVLRDKDKRKAIDLKLKARRNQEKIFSNITKKRQDLKISLEKREQEAEELLRWARASKVACPDKLSPTQIAASKLASIRRRNQALMQDANDALRKSAFERTTKNSVVSTGPAAINALPVPRRDSHTPVTSWTPTNVQIKFKEPNQYSEEVLRQKIVAAILGSGGSLDMIKVLKKGKKALAVFNSDSAVRELMASGLQTSLRVKFKILKRDGKRKRKRKRKQGSRDGRDKVDLPKRSREGRGKVDLPERQAVPMVTPEPDNDLNANDIFSQLRSKAEAARTQDASNEPAPILSASSSVRDIKRWLDVANVSYQHCIEKTDLIKLYRAHT